MAQGDTAALNDIFSNKLHDQHHLVLLSRLVSISAWMGLTCDCILEHPKHTGLQFLVGVLCNAGV